MGIPLGHRWALVAKKSLNSPVVAAFHKRREDKIPYFLDDYFT
jgi:hypothetical protein